MKPIPSLFVLIFLFGSIASAQEAPLVARKAPDWVNSGVIYQINPRAFTKEGTLPAATARIPELARLGVTIIYICPIFVSDDDMRQEFWSPRQKKSGMNNPRNPYRMKDYYNVDPEYGTNDDLKKFVKTAHENKIRVLFDLVYLHCGPSPVFLKDHPDFLKRDDSGKAVNAAWSFPGLNFANPALREYLWKNMEFLIKEFDVDGFRTDVADGIPLDFWEEGRRRIEKLRPDVAMLAEGHKPANQVFAYDMNFGFPIYPVIRDVMDGKKPASALAKVKTEQSARQPKGGRFVHYIDNHDIANDDYDNRRETLWGKTGNEAALLAVFTFDGVPMLYNGQEIADKARHSIFGNLPVDWSKSDTPEAKDRFSFCQKLIQTRKSHPALQATGATKFLDNDRPESVLSFERTDGGETILVAINFRNEPTTVSVPSNSKVDKILLAKGKTVDGSKKPAFELPPYGYIVATVAPLKNSALFPFLISYGGAGNASSMAHLVVGPAGKDGFVRVENGRFATDAGPIRFHATNLTGPANFPTHEQADKLAERLARLGVNCVRMHYFDAYYGNFMTEKLQGIITKDEETLRNLDPVQVDRQDYLIAALKKRGIYTNMNLHVARTFDDRDGFSGRKPWADKGLNSFEPRLLELQREYAKKLLGRVNPYTKLKYSEDPCIAMVEISNESSLSREYRGGGIDTMDDRYKNEFRKQWNRWLKKKYASTDALKTAWQWKEEPLRDEQVSDGKFAAPIKFDGKIWILSKDDAKVEARSGDGVLRLDVEKQGQQYFPKLFRSVKTKKGQVYTLKFRIRRTEGEGNAVLGLAVAEAKDGGWQSLGLHQTLPVGKNWTTFEQPFEASDDSVRGQIQVTRFPKGKFEIADLSLQSGSGKAFSLGGTLEDETIATIPSRGFAPKTAKMDFATFIMDTEERYWTGMEKFLKEELGVRVPISGTQLGYSPPQVQAKLDYVDNHAYWLHPSPVNKDWRIGNTSMVHSFQCILSEANQRVFGKPYTISEYNHPFPNFYGAEGQPMLRAYGALQGWDGVFEYTYNHSPDFEPLRNTYFFSIIARTDVLAHFPACAAMYLRGDVREAKNSVVAALNEEQYMKQMAGSTDVSYGISRAGFDSRYALIHKTGVSLDGNGASAPADFPALDSKVIVSDTGQLIWNREIPSKAYWVVDTDNTKLFSGFPEGRDISLGSVKLTIGETRLNWATVSLTSRHATGFGEKGKANILLAATGYCENENMKVVETGPTSITLSDWGNGTVLCEGIPATLTLPAKVEKVHCYALDPEGKRAKEVPVFETTNGKTLLKISPEYHTIWYEIDIVE